MRILRLSGCGLGKSGISNISAVLPLFPNLQEASLACNSICDSAIHSLSRVSPHQSNLLLLLLLLSLYIYIYIIHLLNSMHSMQKYAETQGRSTEPQFHKSMQKHRDSPQNRHTCIPCIPLHILTYARGDILAHKSNLFVWAYELLGQLLVNCARDLPNLPAGYCSVSCFGETGHFGKIPNTFAGGTDLDTSTCSPCRSRRHQPTGG